MSSSTSHHMVLGLATNDVYNNGKSGPSLGRLLPSHRGNKVIIGWGLQRLHCLRAMWAGAAWRRSLKAYTTPYPPHTTVHAQPLTCSNSYYKHLQPKKSTDKNLIKSRVDKIHSFFTLWQYLIQYSMFVVACPNGFWASK